MSEDNDVHIVLAAAGYSDPDPAAVRAAWERWHATGLLEQQRRHEAELAARDRFEAAADEVRLKCAEKLAAQIEWLEPYVDGTQGEVTAGMAAAYTKAVTALAALFGVSRGRRPVTGRPVVAEPVAVAVEAEAVAAEVTAAVEARAAVAAQLARVRRDMGRGVGELGA